uniref:Vacuolar protein sorting-associated protein 51 homolog n=2 Tax=Kryptolebias marmoratus TaxID=37003 RepID=A0A3Q3AFV6_KRYMA
MGAHWLCCGNYFWPEFSMEVEADGSVALSEEPGRRRRVHGMLKLYYGLNEEGKAPDQPQSLDPCDINGPHFDPELYLNKLRRECSLAELMDHETCMVKQIRSLDSDMQTLVYENYNKFISATDTIRKMKNDFKKMEDEMDCLSANMAAITDFSACISGTLQDQHAQITKLSGVHTLLRKLQFLFELPARLNKCLELQAYAQAVSFHRRARCVLQQYSHLPSFKGIQDDCHAIMEKLAQKLRQKFRDGGTSAKDLSECVELLLQLDEPAEELCDKFLNHARSRLELDLQGLEAEIKPYPAAVKEAPARKLSSPASAGSPTDNSPKTSSLPSPTSNTDILEFIDRGCNEFVSSLCLVITSYQELFINHAQTGELASKNIPQMANGKLHSFVDDLTGRYFLLVERRIQEEKGVGDNSLLVRALDRFHRRLQAVAKLLPGSAVPNKGTEIVIRAATERVKQYLSALQSFYMDSLTDVRQALATPRLSVAGGGAHLGGPASGRDAPTSLPELLSSLSASILNQIKSVLASVHLFTAKDITFSNKPYFKGEFCSQGVRESLVVSFIKFVCQSSRQFCESAGDKGGSTPPALLLLLSRLCLDFETSTISYILTLTDEQFLVQHQSPVTQVTTLCSEAREAAQKLLNHYVKVQGLIISQMLRKSVETRDWVNTIEPRNVRAVMKRVVEDTTSIDVQVGLLYEEGVRKAHSSDSSKRTFSVYSSSRQQARYAASYTPSAPMDTNLLSNIHKLFSERIDIFSSVEFNKVSVMTGIIKISLKTFLECVRLRTFGRYGLQQIQVDCHYLQMYLWRFVSDENLVHFLLDEIVGSSAHRCLDPSPMEQSVIEVICERG